MLESRPMLSRTRLQRLEHIWENYFIFGARWLLVPAYLVLALIVGVLSYKSIEEFFQLILNLHRNDESTAIAQALTIVDLVLVMNLILMVLLVGYMNFVSVIRPDKEEDWPQWMGDLDYSGLKVYVMGTIVAIAAIKLLRAFMNVSSGEAIDHERLLWSTIMLVTFVGSVLMLSVANSFKGHGLRSQFIRVQENQNNYVGIPWVRQEDYVDFRAICEDADSLPRVWERFVELAEEAERRSQAQGYIVLRAYIDPNTFPDWCRRQGERVDSHARSRFAASLASEQHGRSAS